MSWTKTADLTLNDIVSLAELGTTSLVDAYIITRYKQESDGIILLATDIDQLIDMIDDTVPDDATFELWEKEPIEETPPPAYG